jgi:UDPglucose--hexose-1-phosphate uridylyltransferase
VRVLPSPYPVLSDAEEPREREGVDGPPPLPGANPNRDLFWSAPAYGTDEVIVNSPRPVASLSRLTADEVGAAVEVWRERMREHAEAASVQLIVDERQEAGASLPHTHAQLYALPFVPAAVARERERFAAYTTRTMGGNLLGDLVQEEVRKRERIVAIDDDIVLMAPYASRVPYQMMLAPRRPRPRFEGDGPTGASMLHEALRRLEGRFGACPPLNLWVRTAPRGAEHYCWRIDVLPRMLHSAGLERATGLPVNVVAPERAAAELREI